MLLVALIVFLLNPLLEYEYLLTPLTCCFGFLFLPQFHLLLVNLFTAHEPVNWWFGVLVHWHQLQPFFIHEPQGVSPVHAPQVLTLLVQQEQVALVDLPSHTADGESSLGVLFLPLLLLLWVVLCEVSIITDCCGEQSGLLELYAQVTPCSRLGFVQEEERHWACGGRRGPRCTAQNQPQTTKRHPAEERTTC